MALMYTDPFDALFHLQQALDSFRTSDWLETSVSGVGSYPPLNAFRKGDDLVIVAEVPGVRKEDIALEIKDNTLRISGTKTISYGEKAALHRRERSAGRFDRAVALPVEVDTEGVKAECRDGILALYLPRSERDKPRSIRIS